MVALTFDQAQFQCYNFSLLIVAFFDLNLNYEVGLLFFELKFTSLKNMPRNSKKYPARLTFYKKYILYLFRGICTFAIPKELVPVEKINI